MFEPVISVVTIVYNGIESIKGTIQSVLDQTYPKIEYIIIDGGSDDGTVAVIEEFEGRIDFWVSEQDNGIYDAMNKGLEIARGNFVIMMNSGDSFFSSTSLQELVAGISSLDKMYFGRALVKSPFTQYYKPPKAEFKVKEFLNITLPIHQATLVPTLNNNIRYNTRYKIAGDSDYLHRILNKYESVFVDCDLAVFNLGGISSKYKTFYQFKTHLREHLKIVWKYEAKKLKRSIYIVFAFTSKFVLGQLLEEKWYYAFVNKSRNKS